MIDFQRVAEDVRGSLEATGGLDTGGLLTEEALDLLRESTADYAAAVEEVNARLRKCGELIAKGLRSEAIRLCEMEPNLLDLVSLLDLPELPIWRDKLREFELANPPSLNLDVAAELNNAYAIEEPLTAVLRKHRLYALARSPLPVRIATLRELAKMDPDNIAWHDDLRTFERARHEDIAREADRAARRGDVEALESLNDEIHSSAWAEAPRPAVVKAVRSSASRTRASAGKAELANLAPQLNDAFAQFDEEQGLALRARWLACVDIAMPSPDDPAVELAAPALAWLDQVVAAQLTDREYREAVHQLEAALEEGVPLGELERLAHAVLRTEQGIPEAIERRYVTQVESLQRKERFRRLVIGGTVVATVVVVGALIMLWSRAHFQQRDIASHAATLKRLVDEDKLSEASEYLSRLETNSPAIAASPDLADLRIQLEARSEEERRRMAEYDAALATAHEAGVESPDAAALEQAKSLAKTDDEKGAVAELELEILAERRRRQAEMNGMFQTGLDEIIAEVAAQEQSETDEIDERVTVLEALQTKLTDLLKKSSSAEAAVLANATPVQERLRQLKLEAIDEKRAMQSLDEITAAVRSATGYKGALERYVEAFPNTSRAEAFNQVTATELPLWEGLESLNEFCTEWDRAHQRGLEPKAALELATRARGMTETYKHFPQKAELDRRLAYLDAVGKRIGEDEVRLDAELKELLNERHLRGLWLVEHQPDHKKYFLRDKSALKITESAVTVNYLTGFDDSTKRFSLPATDFNAEGQYWHGEAPHSAVAKRALSKIDELDPADPISWERTFAQLYRDIVKEDDPRFEPLVKLLVLQRLLLVGCTGSEAMRQAYSRHLELLEAPTIDISANWLDPDDTAARRASEQAAQIFSRLPSADAAMQAVAASLKQLQEPPFMIYERVGWLARASNGALQARLLMAVAEGDVFVVEQAQPEGPVQIRKVGRAKDDAVTIAPSGPPPIEGRPLYIARPATN